MPAVSPAAPIYILLKDILNPNVGVSSFFRVCLRKNGVLLECNKEFGRAIFKPTSPVYVSNQAIFIEPSATVGQGASYTFKGQLSSLYSAYSLNELKVRVLFPS